MKKSTMPHKILPVVVALAVACQALHHLPFVTRIDAHMQDSNYCALLPGSISVNFSNVGLRRLDSDFTSSPNVSCLTFESNEIEQVSPSAFRLMPNLHYLNLARNRLDFANFCQLDGHPSLRTLVLDDNRDVNLTEGPILRFESEFRRLWFLHARDCGFRDVASLAFAPRLMQLYLSSNGLSASNLSFLEKAAPTLRILDLSDNRLQTFDAGKLAGLNKLHLDGNQFEKLCGKPDCDSGSVLAIAELKKLTHLTLARNAISKIDPSAFDDTVELTHLDLSDNQIQSIEEGTFEMLANLRNLSFKGNQFSEIPDIQVLWKLHHLSFASNNLETVRNGSLSKNVYVRTLDLSHNKIATVEPNAFTWQHFLETLDLSHNKLTNLPNNWLSNMHNLKVLYVNDNLFTALDNLYLGSLGTLGNRTKLKEVYLQNNRITKFNSHSFYHVFIKKIPDIALIFFDAAANSTVQAKSAEECKCDCGNDNDSWMNLVK